MPSSPTPSSTGAASIDPADLLAEACRELGRLGPALGALLGDIDVAVARSRPVPAEWAPVEILCHLRDEETEDFGARLRAVLNGRAEFAPIDPEGWVDGRRYRESDVRLVIADLDARRRASIEFLAGVDPDRLSASIAHRTLGRLSASDIVVAWVAHDRLHLAQLANTLARLWADRWAPHRAEYAGPIPYGDPAPSSRPS